ncbi:adenylate/guanylate cyclase domain-containing protein [Arhodomonas sp. KWT2]|uniref:adenylate/guanylate cyclase domain-containing protein n=1 Tax=Arhodomonas sp. KWT2 TaxID=3344194 RepID=UPI0035BF29A7
MTSVILVIGEQQGGIADALRAADLRMIHHADTDAAREWLAARWPAAVVVGPRPASLELVRELRGHEPDGVTPILVAATDPADPAIGTAIAAGCDDVLTPPCPPAVVRARIDGLLRRADYQRAAARHLGPRLHQRLTAGTATGHGDTETVDACVLFTDLCGFTALSQTGGSAERLFGMVSARLAAQVTAIHDRGGFVAGFSGDGLMALFDGPERGRRAATCALAILATDRDDHTALPLAAGLHAGQVALGDLGSPQHLDYTAIGAPVNVAARLCSAARPGQVLVSEAARHLAGDGLPFARPRERRLRGLAAPVRVYSLAPVTTTEQH